MRFIRKIEKNTGEKKGPAERDTVQGFRDQGQDHDLDPVLRDFRASVHAWSQAAYKRQRPSAVAPVRAGWRRAAAWAMGCVLSAGIAGGGILEYHHQRELARIAAVREAQRQRSLTEQRAQEAAQELARVDSDVAREVPNAMEPLALLMSEDEGQ